MRNYESEAAALRGLKSSSKVLALVLAARMNDRHDDWPGRPVCFPGLDTLKQDTELQERMVRYAIAELVEAKVIRVYKDRTQGSRWYHNVYEWTAPMSPNYEPDWMRRPDKQKSSVGARLADEGWEYCEKNQVGPNVAATEHPEFVLPAEQPALIDVPAATDSARDLLDRTPATPAPKPERQLTPKPADGFAEWWAQYPKKVKKLDAEKAYRAALKRGVTPKGLLDGLQRQKATWKAKGTEPQYIPYPATWLRAGSWEDELDTPMPTTETAAPAINPATGKPVTRDDFGYACLDAGIDPNLYINYWKPHMGLPSDPGWPEWAAKIDRFCGRS
mgnify:CR=1 FL=1